jgi:hypothetical protein
MNDRNHFLLIENFIQNQETTPCSAARTSLRGQASGWVGIGGRSKHVLPAPQKPPESAGLKIGGTAIAQLRARTISWGQVRATRSVSACWSGERRQEEQDVQGELS